MTFEELTVAAKPMMDIMAKRRNANFEDSPFEIVYTLEKGRKYHRVVQDTRNKETGDMFNQRSVSAFLDNEGNIYKPAGWKSPAKTIRGNILNNGGEGAVNPQGFIVYLK